MQASALMLTSYTRLAGIGQVLYYETKRLLLRRLLLIICSSDALFPLVRPQDADMSRELRVSDTASSFPPRNELHVAVLVTNNDSVVWPACPSGQWCHFNSRELVLGCCGPDANCTLVTRCEPYNPVNAGTIDSYDGTTFW